MDRVRAVRLAVKCIQALESYAGKPKEEICDDPLSMAVIGIKGASVVFGAMERLEKEETNWKDRRPKNESWIKYKSIVDILSGRPKAEDCCEACGRVNK